MQKSETRRFLEEQFEKYEQAKAKNENQPFLPTEQQEEGPIDDYLEAPLAYQKEFGEVFKTLPFALRRYLHKREDETAAVLSRLNEELQIKHFLDAAFAEKGCRHGFKNAKDWIEKLIFAEEMMDKSPKFTLRFLARAYGLEPELGGNFDKSAELCELKLGLLGEEIKHLRERIDDSEHHYELIVDALSSAHKAREAGFSPKGKAPLVEDTRNLTTRQILERKFAELED